MNELRVSLQQHVDEYVKNTTVIVKLANFRVTLLGEFYKPGKYMVYQDNITIFQAIAMAGDMTDYAKRSDVVLVRQTKTGSKIHLCCNSNILLNELSIKHIQYPFPKKLWLHRPFYYFGYFEEYKPNIHNYC